MASACLSRCIVQFSSASRFANGFFLSPANLRVTPFAFLQNFPPPQTFKDVENPPADLTKDGKLRLQQKVPIPPGNMKPFKQNRGRDLMRGPEETHNTFLHKQFGIVALEGGRLKYGHFEMIRQTINRNIDTSRMFAVWRVDPPWFSVTKKSQGTRMGGGKASINHYAVPIKAGRVVIEIGGRCHFEEVRRVMEDVAAKLPVTAIATTYEKMEERQRKEEEEKRLNLNPFTMEYVVKNNMAGCNKWLSPYDYMWYGKYR